MSEEYDVFGGLDELCNKNLLAQYKSSAPALSDSNSEDDAALEGFGSSSHANREKQQKEQKKAAEVSLVVSNKQSARKSKGGSDSKGKKDATSPLTMESLPSAPTQREGPQITEAQPVELQRVERRLTRSITKADTAGASQPAAKQQASSGGRGRGRKRQTRAATQSQTLSPPQPQPPPAPGPVEKSVSTRANPIQRGQRRRDYAALMAAQSTNVEYVDLVTSPIHRILGVINVDSDEETPNTVEKSGERLEKISSLDLSFDEENPEISVKIMWNGNPEVFKLRKHQKFTHIFKKIAEREGAEEKNLVFNINNKIISGNDTPASIDYKIYQFIDGRIFVSKFDVHKANAKTRCDANKITLKIQSDQWKRPLKVELLKTDNFKILYIKCAEELSIPYKNLKLSFDGDSLEYNGTPADLDLEGGEAIDLRVKK